MDNDVPNQQVALPQGKYSNFRDPVGLLKRMLLSGNRAAYSALGRAGLAVATKPLDFLLERAEARRLAKVSEDAPALPLFLIVGPPRSGSTLLYQVMARYTDVTYFSNLSELFPRSPISATKLLQRKRQSAGNVFANYYGQTAGLNAPNDGFAVWNRWLGEDRYTTPESIDDACTKDMRRFFQAWAMQFQKPLLNKNNRNAFCLSLLAQALPTARFIVIRRDPLMVAQSLITARAHVQGSKDRCWGLASSESHVRANQPLGYVDDVCDQLMKIEQRLSHQITLVDPSRYVELTYESFCHDPAAVLQAIAQHFQGLQLDKGLMQSELKPFAISATLKLSQPEITQIERRLTPMSTSRASDGTNRARETE